MQYNHCLTNAALTYAEGAHNAITLNWSVLNFEFVTNDEQTEQNNRYSSKSTMYSLNYFDIQHSIFSLHI